MIPLKKAISPEERGIYLLNTPIVPKMTMEAVSIANDPGEFFTSVPFIAKSLLSYYLFYIFTKEGSHL